MPFSNKQSDIFFNDETKEMFVCTVSAITAARCETGDTIYGALPIIYKIDKDTNYKQTVYPANLETFQTDENSDLYNLTPECPVEDLNFDSITKPLINFNKDTSRYSVTFLGRFASDVDGLVINNYIFENVDNRFHLLKAKSLLPENSLSASNGRFTFDGGYLNSDLYVGGNTVRNKNSSWFNPSDGTEIERSPNYMLGPTYVESTSALGFNLMQDYTADTTADALTGDRNFPFMYGGGYITVNPKYFAFDPQHTIRVEFRARSFNTPSPTAYGSTQSVGVNPSRWIQQYSPAGSGEGFSVYFFEQPKRLSYVVPNGVASTLGYSPADFNLVETAGSAQTTVGLFEREYWNPIGTAKDSTKYGYYGNVGDGAPANSFLGVGFDIGGNFVTTSEDKPGNYDGSTETAKPCSVGIRGNRFTNCKVLSVVELSDVPGATSIPLHTSASDAVFVDYRVDLSNKGRRLTVYHKLTSSTDYNTILDLRLNKIQGTGAGNEYDPWAGFNVDPIEENYPLLNVGLSFTTSTKASQFELHSFEVKGVKVHRPWEQKEKVEEETKTRIDYINQSSENLRKRLLNVDSNENVNVEMVVPAKAGIANDIYEETNTSKITLCSDNNPDIIEEEVDVTYKGIRPETIDKVIQATERGDLIPEIGGNPIPRRTKEINETIYEDLVIPVEDPVQFLPKTFRKKCRTAGKPEDNVGLWLYESTPFVYNGNTHIFIMRGIETGNLNTNTLNIYRNENNLKSLARMLTDELELFTKDANGLPYKYWELHVTERSLPGTNLWNSNSELDYSTDIREWSWTPKLTIDNTAWTDEDYAEATIPGFRGPNPGILCALIEEPDPEEGTEDGGDGGGGFPDLGDLIRERNIVVSESAEEEYSGYAPSKTILYSNGWIEVQYDNPPRGQERHYRSPGGTRYQADGKTQIEWTETGIRKYLTELTDEGDWLDYVERQEKSGGYSEGL